MSLHVEERDNGAEIAFYLDGDLQFDSADEAIYHEALALPALCLARDSSPDNSLRVLICGGGDGLALREALRFPGVTAVDLVDYSEEVVALGQTRFASINAHAFTDPRVSVHIADAFEFLQSSAESAYDVILCDFSIPHRGEDARIFTSECYALTARALTVDGIIGINGVSPQRTPEAFRCLNATIASAGLSALPLRVCIPSFLNQGYGAWGFFLAAHRTLFREELKSLSNCPVATTAVDLGRLYDASDFSADARLYCESPEIHTLSHDVLVPLLLNPGRQVRAGNPSEAASVSEPRLPALDLLLESVPTMHAYHTREMVEAVTEQVAGSLRAIDLRRLLDALLDRGKELSADIRQDLRQLRDYIVAQGAAAFTIRRFAEWTERLMIALALLLTMANVVAPDNAFGKGGEGIGHASVSRGYSGSFGHSSEGSFGRGPSGYAAGRSRGGLGSFKPTSSAPDAPITGTGFRSSYRHGEPTDIFGTSYRPRVFRYRTYDTGYYNGPNFYIGFHGGGSSGSNYGAASPEQTEQARFVADDDMLVLENGDVVITLSDAAYLLVSGGTVTLFNNSNPSPLMALYPDPRLFENIQARLKDQKTAAEHEVKIRRDWLSWVSWTAAFSPALRSDQAELASLLDLERRLDAAKARLGSPLRLSLPPDLPANLAQNAVELFVDGGLLSDGRVALVGSDGNYYFSDGKTLVNGSTNASSACPPELTSTLRTILVKMQTELTADDASLASDLVQLQKDRDSLATDHASYETLRQQNGSDYEVDYGTEEISAAEALARTEADMLQNKADLDATIAEREKNTVTLDLISAALPKFAP